MFAGLTRLRTLRLSENLLACDCHLSWLSRFLRGAPRLAPYARCQSPSHLKGQNVANLHVQEFKCSGKCKTNECWTPECWLSVGKRDEGGHQGDRGRYRNDDENDNDYDNFTQLKTREGMTERERESD